MERRIAVRGIAYRDGKLLSVRHKGKNGEVSDFWSIPGGGLDPAEPIEQGVAREMIEETGIIPKVGRLLFVQQFMFPRSDGTLREHLEFFFHLENPEAYETIDLSVTTHGLEELAEIAWIDPMISDIQPEFLRTIDLEAYTTSNQPVYVWNELPAATGLLNTVDTTIDAVA